jgi:TRAP-type C4-dicarboxylate transport system permease small subunit
MNKIIDVCEKVVRKLNNTAAKLAAILTALMMLLTFLDVTGRFVWKPITGTHEITYLALALIIFFTLGYTQQKGGHISIGFLIDKLNKRSQAVIDIVTYIVMLILISLLVRSMFAYGNQMGSGVTGDLGLPTSVFVYACAIGAILYALTIIIDLLKALQTVVTKNEP